MEAFSDGVRSQGVDVIDIGLASSDMVYFAAGHLDRPGVVISASHNPAEYNGAKFCLEGARPVEVAGGEVHHVRRRQPDVDHVDALAAHAVGERVDQGRAGRSHVAADEQLVGPGVAGEGHAEGAGDIGVQLVRHRAADVVGLDDLVEY